MGRVVENKLSPVRHGPKDCEYLYDLSIKLDQLKLQEHDYFLAEGESKDCQEGEKDTKASLASIIGPIDRYKCDDITKSS